MGQLKKWGMQMLDDGSCRITGFDQRGFRHVISSESYVLTEFDSDYICVDGMNDGKHFMCRFRDIDWSRPVRPSRTLRCGSGRGSLWHAVNDLLAESSLYASGRSGVLDLAGLRERYAGMYGGVDINHAATAVIRAVRQRDGS